MRKREPEAPAAHALFRYLTNLSLVRRPVCEKPLLARRHTVNLMVEFGAGVLVLLSAGIFLAHAVAAYRAE